MFRKLVRSVNYLKLKARNHSQQESDPNTVDKTPIPKSINEVKKRLGDIMSDSSDFVTREITMGSEIKAKILVVYIDGLVEKQLVNDDILRPVMVESRMAYFDTGIRKQNVSTLLKEYLLSTSDISEIYDINKSIRDILSGYTVLYIDGESTAIGVDLRGWQSRGISEPETELVVRGPREGFTETLRTNTSLIRRKIIDPNLKFENLTIGERTNTTVCIAYIKDIADEKIIDTVRRRLNEIKTDAILESGYIEEFIEDAPFSIFSTVGYSEKPDVVAGKLLEGRIAILCDGTPFVLTVPYLLLEAFQSSEDYYIRATYASMLRIFRLIAFFITTSLPALYLALINFNPEVIPFKLLLTIASSRASLPYSTFTEAFLMLLNFELLREAGVRIPRPIGSAVSIVGAFVIGDAAVRAGLASTGMIIIIAVTAITSFIVPALSGTLLYLRLALLMGANVLGLLGMAFITIMFLIRLCTIRSFGVPYLSPLSPLTARDLKDTLIRVPNWLMWTRPRALIWENTHDLKYRMKTNWRQKED